MWFLGLLSDHAADMVICSSEGCDESGSVDSLVVEVPGVQSAGSLLSGSPSSADLNRI